MICFLIPYLNPPYVALPIRSCFLQLWKSRILRIMPLQIMDENLAQADLLVQLVEFIGVLFHFGDGSFPAPRSAASDCSDWTLSASIRSSR